MIEMMLHHQEFGFMLGDDFDATSNEDQTAALIAALICLEEGGDSEIMR